MKLVEFEDGTYGLRTYWFFGWGFASLLQTGNDYTPSCSDFKYCKGTLKQAKAELNSRKKTKETINYTIIKDQ